MGQGGTENYIFILSILHPTRTSQSLMFYPLPFSIPTPLPPSPSSHAANLLRRSCLLSLSRVIHIYPSYGFSCSLSSLGLWTVGWLSFTSCLIFTYEGIHAVFVFLCLGYFIQCNFFLVLHFYRIIS